MYCSDIIKYRMIQKLELPFSQEMGLMRDNTFSQRNKVIYKFIHVKAREGRN